MKSQKRKTEAQVRNDFTPPARDIIAWALTQQEKQLRRGLGKPLGGTEISSATAPGDGKMEMEFYLNIMLF